MLTKKQIYLKAYKELEKRRLNRKILQEENLKIACELCPEIEFLTKQINLTSIKLAKLIYEKNSNPKPILEKIKLENLKVQNKIMVLLKKANLPANFLEPTPYCKKCDDYGIFKNERCSCLVKLINSITSKQLLKNSNLPKVSFEDFNLNYYSNSLEENEKVSSFIHMSAVFRECKKYAENFNTSSGGLLMHGLTGLGKTHLSLAIAFSVINKGFTALYETASQITRNFINNRFLGKEENSYINLINDADLLIIDDLGCEFQSQFNKSAIFEVINLRTSFNRPIIINTNLKPEELEKVYGARIISRIVSTLTILSFTGKDNRQKIKLKTPV